MVNPGSMASMAFYPSIYKILQNGILQWKNKEVKYFGSSFIENNDFVIIEHILLLLFFSMILAYWQSKDQGLSRVSLEETQISRDLLVWVPFRPLGLYGFHILESLFQEFVYTEINKLFYIIYFIYK